MIREAHKRATELGYGSVVLLGHKDYYPRFGYKQAIDSGIEFPFDVPHEYCMAIELRPKSLKDLQGMIQYAKPFTEEPRRESREKTIRFHIAWRSISRKNSKNKYE